MSQCPLAHSDAAYVLGALSPADRLQFERHLPECKRCRSSVADLAGMPGLLGRVSAETVGVPVPVAPPPDTVLPALVKIVRRDQRRKAVLVTMSVAAAVAAIAVTATALQPERDDSGAAVNMPPSVSTSTSPNFSPPAPPLRRMQVVIDYGVTANVSLAAVPSGTRVGIDCRYENREADYGEHEYRYDLVAITREGTEELVASWRSRPGDTYTDEITTAIRLRKIVRVEVQSEHGQTILKLDV